MASFSVEVTFKMLEAVLSAITRFQNPDVILLILAGMLWGLIFGMIPGLSGTLALALALVFIRGMDPLAGTYFLISIMGSVAFGGSISAILINTPGTPANVATCLDGFPMSQKGQAGKALAISATASAAGAVFGLIVLAGLIPLMEKLLLTLGPPEFFMLVLAGLFTAATVVRANIVKGLLSALLGLLFALLGLSCVTGVVRFAFGTFYLWDGIPVVPMLIGIFGITEVLVLSGRRTISNVEVKGLESKLDGVKEVWKHKVCFLRSSVIGVVIGIIPGVGGAVSNIVAYLFAKQVSKEPDTFGTGNPEGLIASESANNSKDGGALLPTVAFGISGSSETAVLLGGLTLLGLSPGPLLLLQNLDVVWTLIFGLLFSAILASILGLLIAGTLSRITSVNLSYVLPLVVMFCLIGAFTVHRSILDVIVAVLFGFIGYAMRRTGFPIVPMVIGFLLGNMAENWFFQSLQISRGNYGVFFSRPVSLMLFLMALAVLVFPFISKVRGRSR